MARLHDLQQVMLALGGEALEAPVVEDQQGDFAQAAHQALERAFVTGADERRDQFGDAAIEDGLVLAASLVGERAGDERLSRSCWPSQSVRRVARSVEWDDLIRGLDRLQEATIERDGKCVTTRTYVEGQVGRVFQAAGVALPPNWREHPA